MPKTLHIIGNGFDLHHGIPSAYSDFALYLKNNAWSVYRLVDRYFSVDRDFWDSFEMRLAEFDADSAMDDASTLLSSYGSDDWRDSANHDYQYELEQIGEGLSTGLRGHFADWIRGLPMPYPHGVRSPVRLDPNGLFLSFNYTPTLERLYGIQKERILYIHGCASDPTEALVLGHSWKRRPEERLSNEPITEDSDHRIVEGNSIIDDFFDATFKPGEAIIAANAPFFAACVGIRQVKIMGHSLGVTDEPYIEEIMDQVDLTNTTWTISYFNDLIERKKLFGTYAIDPSLVEYCRLSSF